jgi:hypothetical protein
MSSEDGRKRWEKNPKTENFIFDFTNPKHIEAANRYKEMRDNLKKIQQIATLDQSTLDATQQAEKQRLVDWIMTIDDANFDLRIKIA